MVTITANNKIDKIGETTPLIVPSQNDRGQRFFQIAQTTLLAVIMIVLSVGLINFNNYLMKKGRFPFAVPLVLIHMGFCSVCAFVLFVLKPERFPSLTDPVQKVTIDLRFLCRGSLPIALVFSASLVLTNLAYSHLSIAFLQMVKESNVVLVYFFSVLVGIERFGWKQVAVVLSIIAATMMTVKGELHFELVGFIVQSWAVVCECVRVILQALMLSGDGKKLDPLSYVLVISPICFMILGSALAVLCYLPKGMLGRDLALPTIEDFKAWWPLLLLDSMLAFALNVSIAALIKHTSPVGYILCQILKDVAAVVIGVLVLKNVVTGMQGVGFILQILLVLVWSMMKTFPEKFKDGLLQGIVAVLEGFLPVAYVQVPRIEAANEKKIGTATCQLKAEDA